MSKTLKKSISFILVLALCLSLVSVTALAAQPGMANFTEKKTYTEGHFTDIGGKWYEGSVARGYSLGLIDGRGAGIYDPTGNVTLAEAIKLAACLHSIYNTGEAAFVQGTPWYQVYVDYCLTKGILTSGYPDYKAAATRAQFATIFANALPSAALPAVNTVDDNAIPDVKITDSYGAAVYKLYRAGILTGSDAKGTFNPASNIQRSEMAAIVTRMADAGLRKEVTLTNKAVASLSFNTSMSLTVGGLDTLLISADPGDYDDEVYLSYEIADPSLVTASWSEWDGWDISLYLTGQASGSTYITITMYTTAGDVALASGTVYVSISGSSTGCYAGYYPVADFGVVAGCKAYYVEDGVYYYRYEDIPDLSTALDNYDAKLYSNGFEFWKEDTDSYGDPLLYYYNETYDAYVCIGIDYIDDYVCMFVLPYFGYEV